MSRFLGNPVGRTSGPVPETTGDAVLLYNCSGCFTGSATIPAEKLGVYGRYEITGQTGYYGNYCSQMTLAFAGACGGACADNFASYCCTQTSCGWIGDFKCFNSGYPYCCAGNIPWIFGCGASGCMTACSLYGFSWRIAILPENVCDGSQRGFRYCSTTSMNGNVAQCCIGLRNSGYAINCCGAHPACFKGVCFNTQSATNPFACVTSLRIYGYGKISV